MSAANTSLVYGVPLIVLGCAASAVGLALMKRSGEVEAHVPPYRAWRWLLGFCCLAFLQTFCDAASLSMLPLAVVAPFAGLTIVFSLALAVSGLLSSERESLSNWDVGGAVAVLVGVTCVSLASPHESSTGTLAQASAALLDPVFAAPAGVALVAAASCLLGAHCARMGGVCRPTAPLAACGAAACGALSQFAIKVLSLSVREAMQAPPTPGGTSAVASLLAWAHPTALCSLCAISFTAPTQLLLLQHALSARASLVVPLYQASLVSLTTLTGGVAFHEFRAMAASSALTYALGLLVATAGLLALSRADDADAAADDASEEEAASECDAKAAALVAAEEAVLVPTPLPAPASPLDASARDKLLAPLLLSGPSLDLLLSPTDSDGGRTASHAGATPSQLSATPSQAGATPSQGVVTPSPPRHAMLRPHSPRPRGASRLPAPMLMGLGVAMLETKQMRTSMQLGRARAVSDARAISNQRRTMRPPVVPHSRGRSASTLT